MRRDAGSMTPCFGRKCALVEQGWSDALRALHPGERIYTFWKYFRNAFARDAGLRIDHLLLSPSLAGRLVAAGVDRDVRARERSSDHAPVWIELADASTRSRRPAQRRTKHRSVGPWLRSGIAKVMGRIRFLCAIQLVKRSDDRKGFVVRNRHLVQEPRLATDDDEGRQIGW